MSDNLKIMVEIINIAGKIIAGFFILAFIIFVTFILTVTIFGLYAHENKMSDYSYDLYLSTSKPVHNATLLLPLPCRYDKDTGDYYTFISLPEISTRHFDMENTSTQIELKDGYIVLNISAESILPLYKNHIDPVPIYPGQNESELPPTPTTVYSNVYSAETPGIVRMEMHRYYLKEDGEINTKQPFEEEMLMRPFFITDMTGNEDSVAEYTGRTGDTYSESPVEVPVCLSYDTDSDTNFSISCSLRGANEWHVLGWQWNSYEQIIGKEFTGPHNGTYMLEGKIIACDGIY
ncbi:MAG: hypothetical protein JW931_03015 [Methanomicrobiaceae archaeon]|nr:hypothetical protein [Methanomicrobiaceae archaeon]